MVAIMPITKDDLLSLLPDQNDYHPGLHIKKDLGLELFQNVVIQKAINFPIPLYVVTYNSRYPERAIFYSKVRSIKTSFLTKLKQYGIDNKFKHVRLTPPIDLTYFNNARPRSGAYFYVRDMAGETFRDEKMFQAINESLVEMEDEKDHCLFTGSTHNLPRPTKKLIEDVLNPDYVLQIVRSIQKNKQALIHSKTAERLVDLLNDILVQDNIYFIYNKFNDDLIYKGGFYKKTGEIEIHLGQAINNILEKEENFNSFLLKAKEVIGHELIHRLQFIKDNEKKMDAEKYDTIKEYLSSPYEIMSFAWQIVEWHRNDGMDDDEIKKMLQKKDLGKYKNGVLDKFHDVFSIADKPLRLLYKYMYMYLDA